MRPGVAISPIDHLIRYQADSHFPTEFHLKFCLSFTHSPEMEIDIERTSVMEKIETVSETVH